MCGEISRIDELTRENAALRRQIVALEAEKQSLWATFQSIGDAVISADTAGNVLQMNSVAEALTGWTEVDARERTTAEVFSIVDEHSGAAVENPIAQLLRNGTFPGFAGRTLLIAKNGTEHPIAHSGALLRDENGEVTGVALIFRDQTEERRAETERNRIAEQRQLALDAANLGWWHYDPVTQVASYDARYTEIFGVVGSERPNDEILKLLHPDDLPNVWAAVEAALDPTAPKPYSSEYRVNRPDGTLCWVEAHGIATFEGDGDARHATSLVGTVADITERRQAQRQIESLARFPDENPNPVMRLLHDGTITYANKGSHELLATWNCLVGGRVNASLLGAVVRAIAQQGVITEEVTANGRVVECMFVWVPGVDYLNVYGRDVTERKRAEACVQEGEQRYRSLFEGMLNGLAYCKMIFENETPLDFVYLEVNVAFETLTGLKNVTGKRVSEVIPGIRESDPLLFERYSRVALTGVPERFETYVAALDMWFSISVYSPQKGYFTAVFDVITERKRAEAELRESEDKFRHFFEHSVTGKSITLPTGKATVNQAFSEMLGYAPGELSNTEWRSLTHPDDVALTAREINAVLRGEKSFTQFEKRFLRKDGAVVWTHLASTVRRDAVGNPLYLMTSVVDISDRKRAEAALRASESRLRRFYESGMIGVIYWNMDGKITEANDKFLEMVGYTRDDLANGSLDWGNMTPPEYRQQDENSTFELRTNGVNQKPFEKEYIRKDGTRIPILLAGAMLDDTRFNGVAFVLDISAHRRAEEKIHQLNSDLERRVSERTTELEASNKELEAFSYSVSHDLRAPLRAIDGFTRILYDDFGQHLDAEGKRLCDVIRENAGRMGRLIDDLLSFSRLGRTAMLPSQIDMATMVNSVFYELSTPESRERIDLHIGSVPTAFGDPSLMRQVWANLLSNAIKFTSKVQRASIEVTGEQTDRECLFTVKDNGAGFDMQYVSKLFGVFQRLHSTKEFEGTGVGLALVQRIIRRHGGRVWAEGEIDRGAKFCFALPKKEA